MSLSFDLSPELKEKLCFLAKRDKRRLEIINKKIKQIIESDETTIEHYKNLRYSHSDRTRVHIDKSFVLTFKYDKAKKFVLFLDFDHHDNIYMR